MPGLKVSVAQDVSDRFLGGYRMGADIQGQRTALAQRQQALDQQAAQDQEMRELRLANLELARQASMRADRQDAREQGAFDEDRGNADLRRRGLTAQVTGQEQDVQQDAEMFPIAKEGASLSNQGRKQDIDLRAELAPGVREGQRLDNEGRKISNEDALLERSIKGKDRASKAAAAARALGDSLNGLLEQYSGNPDMLGSVRQFGAWVRDMVAEDPERAPYLLDNVQTLSNSLHIGSLRNYVDKQAKTVEKWAEDGMMDPEGAKKLTEMLTSEDEQIMAAGLEQYEQRSQMLQNKLATADVTAKNLSFLDAADARILEDIGVRGSGFPTRQQMRQQVAVATARARLTSGALDAEEQFKVLDALSKELLPSEGPDPDMELRRLIAGDIAKNRRMVDAWGQAGTLMGGQSGPRVAPGVAAAQPAAQADPRREIARQMAAQGASDEEIRAALTGPPAQSKAAAEPSTLDGGSERGRDRYEERVAPSGSPKAEGGTSRASTGVSPQSESPGDPGPKGKKGGALPNPQAEVRGKEYVEDESAPTVKRNPRADDPDYDTSHKGLASKRMMDERESDRRRSEAGASTKAKAAKAKRASERKASDEVAQTKAAIWRIDRYGGDAKERAKLAKKLKELEGKD